MRDKSTAPNRRSALQVLMRWIESLMQPAQIFSQLIRSDANNGDVND
jgi:hypothetical protein